MQGYLSLKKLKRTGRLALPYVILALFMMINLINLPFSSTGAVKPYLIVSFIYYWAIYRPTIIPPLLCFLLGVLMDILSGTPIGLHAFIFVGVQWLIRDQRRFLMGQPYGTIWAVFGLVCVACGAWQWGLLGLTQLSWPSPLFGLISIAMSLVLFPFISLLLNAIHRILPVASRSFP